MRATATARAPRSTASPSRPSASDDARGSAPPRVALTGGIGAGKSEALAAFAACGAAVLSADALVHEIYRDPEVVAAVAERFGADLVRPDGDVDRPLLGRRAFAQEGGVAFLEGLIHPRVEQGRLGWEQRQLEREPPAPLLVVEVPLLFEADLDGDYDAVLVVTASEPVRRERVAARGQDFAGRSARQVAEAEKVARADRAFVNDGSLEELRAWVAARFAEYAGRPCASP